MKRIWFIAGDKLIFIGVLCLVAYCYYPALYSVFLLDDYYNLGGLSDIEQRGVLYYITGGFAGPSGRPLSLLSFALQYQAWPTDPVAFKTVNLVIHLINGVLIWLISRHLIKQLNHERRYQGLFSILVAAIWLLHPIQLSTVLYTVQRMTQLACLFSLLGVYSYLCLRAGGIACKKINYYLLSIAVFLCTVFAVLSKENGILLVLFILVIETTLLLKKEKPDALKRWMAFFLVLPLLLLSGYLIATFDNTLASYHSRPFTMYERLLTEPVVLLTYLNHILLPTYGAFSLFHDDFPISTGLLSPPLTFFALLFVLSTLGYAISVVNKKPVLSFAILWFIGGHLLESTHLNLELYFEHRNYLPSFGIIFGGVYFFLNTVRKIRFRLISVALGALYLMLIFTVFLIEKSNWSQPLLQAAEWVRLKPESSRSLNNLAAHYIQYGKFEQAKSLYMKIQQMTSNVIYPELQILRVNSCEQKIENNDADWRKLIEAAGSAKPQNKYLISVLDQFIINTLDGKCQGNTLDYLDDLLSVLIANQHYGFVETHLYTLSTIVNFHKGDYQQALAHINQALQFKAEPSSYARKFQLLKQLNRHSEFAALKEEMRQAPASWDLKKYILYYRRMQFLNTNTNEESQ